MKLLVIGSGGREHALVWKLAQSPHVTQMWCAPGNAGIAQERLVRNSEPVECVPLGAEDLPKLQAFAHEKKIELTVVGPDNPLAVPVAAIIGIPIYIRAETMIPIGMALIEKGMSVGAVLALIIGGAGASIPELMLLSAIFKRKMLAAFVLTIFTIAVAAGYLANLLVA